MLIVKPRSVSTFPYMQIQGLLSLSLGWWWFHSLIMLLKIWTSLIYYILWKCLNTAGWVANMIYYLWKCLNTAGWVANMIYYLWKCLNTSGWVANSVDFDQMLPSEATGLGLHCFLRHRVNLISAFTLRKHAYSNIWKISPPKTENFQIKNSGCLQISAQNIDYASRRQF